MSELKEIRDRALVDVRTIVQANTDRIREAYEIIMRLSYQARSEGLLAMEYEAGRLPKDMPFCREIGNMVRLVAEGTSPAYAAEWMTLRFMSENYQGWEALLYFLYARGILMIQAGESPYMIEGFFQAVIPQDLLPCDRWQRTDIDQKLKMVKEIRAALSEQEKMCLGGISEELFGLTEAEWKDILQAKAFYAIDRVIPYLDKQTQAIVQSHVNEGRYGAIMQSIAAIKEQEIYQCYETLKTLIGEMRAKPEEQSILSEVLQQSDAKMRKLIAELDAQTIALALKGESKEVSDRFFRNMPPRLKYEIQEEMAYMGPVRRCDAEEAQRKIRRLAEDYGKQVCESSPGV